MHAGNSRIARVAGLAAPLVMLTTFATITFFVAFMVAARAQQPSPAGTAPAKPLVPITASTLAGNPDAFIGEWVSVTGVIAQSLSRLAFAVDQGKLKSAGDVLVLAPRLNSPVDPNTYVTVVGEVVRFDPDALARKSKDYAVDLSPDLVAKYRGKPAVLATSVINSKMVDLAKRLPPPMSAEEQAFDNIMKKVGPAFAAMRQADASTADVTKENAAVLKQAFADTEAFWKTRGKTDAVQWAQEARKHVEAIDHAAAAGNWDEVKSMAGTLGQSCQSCHGAYRERFDDGSYRIKEPPKPGGN
jgi:cytochrome c556